MKCWTSLWFKGLNGSLPHLSLSGLPQKARRLLSDLWVFSQKYLFFSFPWLHIVCLGKCCRCWCTGRWLHTMTAHLWIIPAKNYKYHLGLRAFRHLEGLSLCFQWTELMLRPLAHCEPGLSGKRAGTQEAGEPRLLGLCFLLAEWKSSTKWEE